MKTKDTETKNDEVIEEILAQARPREPAPDIIRRRAFAKLHGHWKSQIVWRQKKRLVSRWAIAASVVLAVALSIFSLYKPEFELPGTVADISKIAGEEIEWISDSKSFDTAYVGLRITEDSRFRTGEGTRVALTWHDGGRLRLDENSVVEFQSPDRIRLIVGAIYYDSYDYDEMTNAPSKGLTIVTPFGGVRHVGTQFAVRIEDDSMLVRVREGRVQISTATADVLVDAESELYLDDSGQSYRQYLATYDPEWEWIQLISPDYAASGKTPRELLEWIGRETGRRIDFVTDSARADSDIQRISGLEHVTTDQALAALVYTTGLQIQEFADRIEVNSPE